MFRLRKLFAFLFIGVVLAVAGCDTPTDPQVELSEPELGLLGSVTGTVAGTLRSRDPVSVLKRTVPLEHDLTVTRTIGPAGGRIRIPEAGLTVTFPPRALRRPTEITVTAPAGDLVGYHFAPHGLEFQRSVRIRQNLSDTEAAGVRGLLRGLKGAYFLGDLSPTVLAREILDLRILGGLLGQFEIDHFSGYVIATD